MNNLANAGPADVEIRPGVRRPDWSVVTLPAAGEAIQATGTAGQAVRQRLAVTGGLLGGLAAMSCCIIPLVLFSLGAGGAWVGNLTALAPYQPIFVTMALGSIGYGFWLVYRRREACADGDACARPLPKRSVKLGLWAATFMTAAALAFPFVAPILLEI